MPTKASGKPFGGKQAPPFGKGGRIVPGSAADKRMEQRLGLKPGSARDRQLEQGATESAKPKGGSKKGKKS